MPLSRKFVQRDLDFKFMWEETKGLRQELRILKVSSLAAIHVIMFFIIWKEKIQKNG